MDIEKFRRALNARPFRPFRLVCNAGFRQDITDPARVLCPPDSKRTAIVMPGGDGYHILDLAPVDRLELIEEAVPGNRAGR